MKDEKNYYFIMELLNIKDFEELYNITYPEYIEVTKDEFVSRIDQAYYRFFIKELSLILNNVLIASPLRRAVNVIYRNKCRKENDRIYKRTKHWNLSNPTIFEGGWKRLYPIYRYFSISTYSIDRIEGTLDWLDHEYKTNLKGVLDYFDQFPF